MNKRFQIILAASLILILGFIFMSKTDNKTNTNMESSGVKRVDALAFGVLAKDSKNFLLDVHTPEQEHIPGTDAFIPFNEIIENQDKLPSDKNTPILVYCRSGSMSRDASLDLQKLGYTNIYDLEGGIDAYREANVSVEIEPSTIDLGTVIYGDIAKTEFKLTNFTSQEVNITKVATSCGCTSAEVEKKSLKPYESTKVKVSFNPAIHKDDTDLGELTRTIYINTNNVNFKQITATITAIVVRKDGE